MSEQVPAKIIILTDGLSRRAALEKMTLVFRRAAPCALLGSGQRAGMVIQALRYLKGSPALARHLAQFNKTLDSGTMCAHRSRNSALFVHLPQTCYSRSAPSFAGYVRAPPGSWDGEYVKVASS